MTLETKIAILNRLADGEGSTALGKEYKLGEYTIRAIQKRASRINESKNSATNESDYAQSVNALQFFELYSQKQFQIKQEYTACKAADSS
uniref:HTH psq-type domain-containing protein n=1 Tax=Glossina palpalis gambiensis TaxID=67801 RepID=A0A1B0BV69_9MUSC